MTEIHRSSGRSLTDEIEELAKDRHAEATLADRLAETGHHASNCRDETDEILFEQLHRLSGPLPGTRITLGPPFVEPPCTCGWSDALKAWQERRNGQ